MSKESSPYVSQFVVTYSHETGEWNYDGDATYAVFDAEPIYNMAEHEYVSPENLPAESEKIDEAAGHKLGRVIDQLKGI